MELYQHNGIDNELSTAYDNWTYNQLQSTLGQDVVHGRENSIWKRLVQV